METGLLSSQVNVATTPDMPKSKQISNTHVHIYMLSINKNQKENNNKQFLFLTFPARKKTKKSMHSTWMQGRLPVPPSFTPQAPAIDPRQQQWT